MDTRIYLMSSAPHGPGPFPPASNRSGDLIGLGKISATAVALVQQGYLLVQDLPDVINRASAHWDWVKRR